MFIVVARDGRRGRTLVLEPFEGEEQATRRLAELMQQYWDEDAVQVDGFVAESVEQFLRERTAFRLPA